MGKQIKLTEAQLQEMISESLRSFGKGMGAVGKKMANDVRKANGKAYFPELSDKSYGQTYSDAAKRQEYLDLIDYLKSFRGSTEARVYRIADAAKKGLISKEAAEKAIAYETKPMANARDLEASCAAVSAGCLANDPDYGQVRLTEQQLQEMITEAIVNTLNESCDEGFFNNLGTGAKTFFSNKHAGKGLGSRFDAAKKNFQAQGKLDNMKDIIAKLSALVDEKAINPNTTVAQLIGGKYNGNKFGKMTGMAGNFQSQINKRME